MDDHRIAVKKELSIKELLSKVLFDKENPDMVTFLFDEEIEYLSAMETLMESENKVLNSLDYPENPYEEFIKKIKVNRTSRKGWRAEQGEKIIKSHVEDESTNTGLKKGFGRFFGN